MDFQLSVEQKMLVELADKIGRNDFAPKAARWDKNHEYPYENVESRENGQFYCKKIEGREGNLLLA